MSLQDFMDIYEAEEERYDAWAQCVLCREWTLLEGSKETYGQITKNQKCFACRGQRFDPHSVTSKRTFNPIAAKKRIPKGFKKP